MRFLQVSKKKSANSSSSASFFFFFPFAIVLHTTTPSSHVPMQGAAILPNLITTWTDDHENCNHRPPPGLVTKDQLVYHVSYWLRRAVTCFAACTHKDSPPPCWRHISAGSCTPVILCDGHRCPGTGQTHILTHTRDSFCRPKLQNDHLLRFSIIPVCVFICRRLFFFFLFFFFAHRASHMDLFHESTRVPNLVSLPVSTSPPSASTIKQPPSKLNVASSPPTTCPPLKPVNLQLVLVHTIAPRARPISMSGPSISSSPAPSSVLRPPPPPPPPHHTSTQASARRPPEKKNVFGGRTHIMGRGPSLPCSSSPPPLLPPPGALTPWFAASKAACQRGPLPRMCDCDSAP